MPGIVGLITKMPRQWAEPQLKGMVDSIRHLPSYETGTWINEELGAYAGWAVLTHSTPNKLPFVNERNDITMLFAGEEFPAPAIAWRLKQRGHRFNRNGYSYLVHWYEEDPDFWPSLNGRFHGLIADAQLGIVTLFNDRYGMHRLYYHESKEAVYFAAEAKAILQVCPELRCIDAVALGEFITCGCVLQNRTLFRGIGVLPAASTWQFRHGSLDRKVSYFDPQQWECQPHLEPDKFYDELRGVFSENLRRYFTGPRPTGVSLTGGLDTRMIMAWHRPAASDLTCYSFGGMFRDSQDVVVARKVADCCGYPYEVISLDSDFLYRFPDYAERTVHLSDGCTDVSHSPDLYLSERAADISLVRMTGNYGGEVLRRVRAFKPFNPVPDLFCPELFPSINRAGQTYARITAGNALSFAVFRQAPWHHYGLLALEQSQLTVRSPYLDNDFVCTVFRAPDASAVTNEFCLRLIADGNPHLCRIRTDRGLGGRTAPLLSASRRWLLESTFKSEYAYDYGMPQWLARVDYHVSRLHLERWFLGRHKFSHFRIWYRDALPNYVRQMLLDPRTLTRPYLQPRTLESLVKRHLKGDRNYTSTIHKLLTLELIHRLFVDSK